MTMSAKTLTLNGQDLSVEQLVEAGHDPSINITIQPSNWPKIEQCRALVEKWADEEQVIYGVNTSCGGLVNYLLPRATTASSTKPDSQCVNQRGYFSARRIGQNNHDCPGQFFVPGLFGYQARKISRFTWR